jgi:hypothetical protein
MLSDDYRGAANKEIMEKSVQCGGGVIKPAWGKSQSCLSRDQLRSPTDFDLESVVASTAFALTEE